MSGPVLQRWWHRLFGGRSEKERLKRASGVPAGGNGEGEGEQPRGWPGVGRPPAGEGEAGGAPAAQPDTAGLEKEIRRLGREQFRLNALVETQQREFQTALQQLREQDQKREREMAEASARRPTEQAEARLQVAQRLLPVLDGLDQALSSGERLLERGPSPARLDELGRQKAALLPWWVVAVAWPIALIAFFWPGRAPRGSPERACAELARDVAAWRASYVAWLHGLELVRERLLETLALEGVQPIAAAGQAFDPRRHVAVDTVPARPAVPPGTIVAEVRRGYAAGDRVLRYPEVVVARGDERSSERR